MLEARDVGDTGYLAFQCRVGHAFSGESLVGAKEDQLEAALWDAIEAFEEIVTLHRDLAKRLRGRRAYDEATAYLARAGRAEENSKALRAMIEHDRPASGARSRVARSPRGSP